ncbi:unnamed protein product [Haemonchus placei]|uniref:Craniofacial development protein 2-like n=1 Tax=Haemonchus placei TaxID=6290 RepID=A0A0N4W3F9_HAEPC|nr:unnamed protein product [Haemonchus placei]
MPEVIGHHGRLSPTRIRRLYIGTINSRSISTAARQIELDNVMEKIKCDILYIPGVTEARIPCSGSYELPSSMILFYSGGETAHCGMAFFVGQPLAREVRFTPISDRLGNLYHPSLKVFVIVCYAPASSKDKNVDYENFLEEVERTYRRVLKGVTPIILGDMYAKMGREVRNEQIIGKYTIDALNDGGRLLTDMLTKLGLRA